MDLEKSRTHEPTTRELVAEFDGFCKLMNERDRRYADKFQSADEKNTLALSSSKEAVTKAEIATEKRFECVSVDTPILCCDLVWRPAGELKVGDELIGLDEWPPTRSGRRFRRATVTHHALSEDKLLIVRTPLGSVRCNPHHPWLVRDHEWKWIEAQDLKVGNEVAKPLDIWATDTSWEAGWLAGMYDGEGCLSVGTSVGKLRVQLSISQRESPTSAKVASALMERLGRDALAYRYEPGTPCTPKNKNPFFHFLVVRKSDILKILGSVRPPRLLLKATGVWEDKVIAGNSRWAVVTSVEDAGTGTIARLSTSTKTYIANGFAMHNSVNEFRQSLTDQNANFVSRAEFSAKLDAMTDKLEGLRLLFSERKGHSLGTTATLGAMAVACGLISGLVFGILNLILKK